jgi:hypothetical protein
VRDIKDEIIDAYTWHCRIEAASYKMMGEMLDDEMVRKRLKRWQISDVYIYGGTYLAAQLYRAIKNYTKVRAVVDRAGRSVLKMDVPVITLEELQKIYVKEKVIITPPRFYREAKNELAQFIELNNILYLGEFLEGVSRGEMG